MFPVRVLRQLEINILHTALQDILHSTSGIHKGLDTGMNYLKIK